ncbi:ATP-binding protein [Gluconobacter cerinus]|uniref:AAA family ATPase n=1 Tax=Gluconobacter cerinus TaxID=38307 RepID=UPI001B8D747F|nr:ATP-binding protein [Gluconobacter cerinus]MBS0982162.1 ATP-binding protein [Gluconobacter cerinus]
MSRADLVIQLAEAGAQNDHVKLERIVAALVAEARAKQHHTLADRLAKALGAVAPPSRQAPRAVGGTVLPEKVRDLLIERPARRGLGDLTLPSEVDSQVRDLIEEQHRADFLRANSLEPRHRIMLAGPPGNGKTTLAEAIAFSLGVPFYTIRYDAVIDSYLGETAARLRRVFDYARATPCVLFLDEFDALGKERGDVHETGEIKRVVSSLLLQMDDLPSYTVIVCASNHPELLDRAVWRRFQLRLELPMPTRADFRRWLAHVGADRKSLGMDPNTLARDLEGGSYAEAEEFLMDVKRKIVLSGGPPKLIVTQQLKAWKRRFWPKEKALVYKDGGQHTSNSSASPDT